MSTENNGLSEATIDEAVLTPHEETATLQQSKKARKGKQKNAAVQQ